MANAKRWNADDGQMTALAGTEKANSNEPRRTSIWRIPEGQKGPLIVRKLPYIAAGGGMSRRSDGCVYTTYRLPPPLPSRQE